MGLEPKFEVKRFENKLLEKKFVIESNLLRRQLTTFQRIEMGLPLLEIERELAKERQGTRTDIRQNFDGSEMGRALDRFAEKVGSNRETVNQALWLIDHAPKEALDKLRSGEKAISNLYKKIKGRKEPAEPPPWLSFIVASTVSVPEVIPLFADWQLHDAEHFKESIIF